MPVDRTMVPRTHGPLRRGNDERDDRPVIHRSQRRAPTFPARRGMRAAWFRGRHPAEGEASAAQEQAGSVEATAPTDAPAAPPAPPATSAGSSPVMPPVRPVHGHPTF
jgi:hypothetical protein